MRRAFIGVVVGLALTVAPSASAGLADDAKKRLGAGVRVAVHDQTGKVRFIGTTAGRPIARPAGLAPGASPEAIARAFLRANGKFFGVRDQARELRLIRTQDAANGRAVARFQQLYRGIPVLAGELAVNMTGRGAILSANGEALPGLNLSVSPGVSAGAAAQAARAAVSDAYDASAAAAKASSASLWIYDQALLGGAGPKGSHLVWRMDVTVASQPDVRELVLVDAQTGAVVLHFNQIAHAKNRKVCNANNTASKYPCTSGFARVEGQAAVGIADVDLAYDYAGNVYDFFKSRFNRDSIDGKGMAIVQTVKYCDPDSPCPFENAFWDGNQMVYGTNYASADDVVGHELAHGVTDRTAGLFYWYQAGAINESLSDVFGELVDLGNGRGGDSAAARWQMGEDLPIGAIRDMKNPPAFGHPDRMQSPIYDDGYDSFNGVVEDSGGVHTNSGVNNKAAYLLTDGGTFNGRTVAPLGLTKVAKLYYEVVANLLTSGSDYEDLHEALFQACQNLVGAGLTTANCTAVRNATLATQMNLQPTVNGPGEYPAVPEAPMCAAGQVPVDLFYDNFENLAANNWTRSAAAGTNKWGPTTGYATSGMFSLYTEDQTARSDTAAAKRTAILIPAGTTYLRFSHAMSWEFGFDGLGTFIPADGGVVEYSEMGGPWTDAGALFTHNGYWAPITNSFDNPLAGRMAFTDVPGGFLSSRINLSSHAGHNIAFRFRAGTDTGNLDGFFWGWSIDDIRVHKCVTGSRPAGSTANLLRNPGFEWDDNDDAYADFWSQNSGALRMFGVKRGGTSSARLFRGATVGEQAYNVNQRVPAVAGGTYALNGYVRIPTTAVVVNNVKVQFQFLSSAGAVLTTKVVKAYTNDTTGAWNLASGSAVAPAGTTAARVQILHPGSNVQVYVDDFRFRRTA